MTALVDTSASSWDRTSTQNTTIISISIAASSGCVIEVALVDVPRRGTSTQPGTFPSLRRPPGVHSPLTLWGRLVHAADAGPICRRAGPQQAQQATIGDDHETDRIGSARAVHPWRLCRAGHCL